MSNEILEKSEDFGPEDTIKSAQEGELPLWEEVNGGLEVSEMEEISSRCQEGVSSVVNNFGKVFDPLERSQDGWFSDVCLSHILNVDVATVNNFASRYRESNPEWFELFLANGRQTYKHYAPELVAIIKTEFSRREKVLEQAPIGWFHKTRLAGVLYEGSETIEKIAAKFRKSNPEWFKMYFTKAGFKEHYAPELVEEIKNEFSRRKAPKGWFHKTRLAVVLYEYNDTVEEVASKYRKSNPEWFKKYFTKAGFKEHYAPELVEIIRRELEKKRKR